MKITPELRENLEKVKSAILAEPRQFDMDNWFSPIIGMYPKWRIPNCSTAACIAGWMMAIEKGMTPKEAAEEWLLTTAVEALSRLFTSKDDYEYLRSKLFFATDWPEPFYSQYCSAHHNFEVVAQVAANRIDHFLATGK